MGEIGDCPSAMYVFMTEVSNLKAMVLTIKINVKNYASMTKEAMIKPDCKNADTFSKNLSFVN